MFSKMGIKACGVLMCLLMLMQSAFADTADLIQGETETYECVSQYIDQGDAKKAMCALLEADQAESVYARMHMENSVLLENVLLEAAALCNEDGELYSIALLRLKGFLTDDLFLKYWECVGHEIPDGIKEMKNQFDYDVYLFYELLNWYERGSGAIADIVDLRYSGFIDDKLYTALVQKWQVDLMDGIDLESYIPLRGVRLSEEEKDQIRTWQIYVDEGESREAAAMVIRGDITENASRWLYRNDANLVNLLYAQAMFENATEGSFEENLLLILSGSVSDACFERYWELVGFSPIVYERTSVDYPNVDMYFVYEVERISTLTNNDSSLLQWLWNEELIDEYTFDQLVNRIGSWEIDNSEM